MEESWIIEANEELKEEFDNQPKYLLIGLRSDSHYGYNLQDEIEIMQLHNKREVRQAMGKRSGYKWKEVRVYELGEPIINKKYGRTDK